MAKPPLTLIAPNAAGVPPPRKLGEHGLALWDSVNREYRVDDIAGIEILMQACLASDRVNRSAPPRE
jgi:hypothetical protein